MSFKQTSNPDRSTQRNDNATFPFLGNYPPDVSRERADPSHNLSRDIEDSAMTILVDIT
jgi:hypothetical protein